jgi:hypothetical protein
MRQSYAQQDKKIDMIIRLHKQIRFSSAKGEADLTKSTKINKVQCFTVTYCLSIS